MKIAIIGCGYAGRVLAHRMIEQGRSVRTTTTTGSKLSALAAMGAEPVLMDAADSVDALADGMDGARAVVYLAPPIDGVSPDELAVKLADACPADLETFVYGSTTSVFGKQPDPEAWVDETTAPCDPAARGRRRWAMEQALQRVGLPLKIVRIAAIYGPGRTLRSAIERGSLLVVEGAPPTSRIHVEDLATILGAMTDPYAPKLCIATDDLPATTLEVARYTSALLGAKAPTPISIDDAKRVMSESAMETRLSGHRCRSHAREELIGDLTYPTYREGVLASLQAVGALR